MTRHVVLFSGGIASWGAAKRVAERHGPQDITLLFCDTMMEDEDLYRFLPEAAASVGGELVRIADGRTPWQVFEERRFLGNTRVDLCSRILKRELTRTWLTANCDPAETVVYLGFDWTEMHRMERAVPHWAPWRIEAPLCEPPFIWKSEVLATLTREGIAPPRLYEWAAHNNCGGFCVKAGIGHFVRLLKAMPERYRWHEEKEDAFRARIGKDVAILRDRRGGVTKPLTMRDLRLRVEQGEQFDMFDIGGCGCMEEPIAVAEER